ncbi:MAG: TspO/MBR family protein [Bacteroidota bacterium]
MNETIRISSSWKLIIAIVICEGTGILSGLLAGSYDNSWFLSLKKPDWNPPPSIFGPVWTTLYLLMAFALWLVWKNSEQGIMKSKSLFLFGMQLFLNFWWSVLFFRWHSTVLALADIVLMVIFISFTILNFRYFSKYAAAFLLPYLLWVLFATALNFSIWRLN